MTEIAVPEEQAGQDAGAVSEAVLDGLDEQLIDRLVGQARERGVKLAGEGGLLAALTKRLLESALDGEITDHLGYERHDPAGRNGGNSRNGSRAEFVPFLGFDAEIRRVVGVGWGGVWTRWVCPEWWCPRCG